MTSGNRSTNRQGTPSGVRFGGWSDYQEWADHDFRQRVQVDEAGGRTSQAFAVPVLTELAPITLPDDDAEAGVRTACVLVPPPHGADATVDRRRISGEGADGARANGDLDGEAALIRPYVRAGGRAEARYDLEFEALLTATGLHESWAGEQELSDDQLVMCGHCGPPRSVAEIAAVINAPIGVAKVLIGDAIDQGLLVLHERTPVVEGRFPLELLKRVHAGIAKLA